MSILAVIAEFDDVERVLPWAIRFAEAQRTSLSVLCWSRAAAVQYPLTASQDDLPENDATVERVREYLSSQEEHLTEPPKVLRTLGPDRTTAVLDALRGQGHGLLITAGDMHSSANGISYSTNALLRRSPIATMVLLRTASPNTTSPRVMVIAADSPHDQSSLEIAAANETRKFFQVALVRVEEEAGAEATELGRRELTRMLRDAGVKAKELVKRKVYAFDDLPALADAAESHDLVMIGANQERLARRVLSSTTQPCVAVVKRAPPLKRLRPLAAARWRTRLSPADYADMMQGLRRGADLNSDFLIMLGLAAAIASLGLLQDSPAVVIGSMLLAPLMTPMIACGLAIAQGNQKLGRRSLFSILVGFLQTLVISYCCGAFSSSTEITSQVVARGDPNILDLLIALCSAAAAAYALARPSIVGAVAGVAIATALVPPLCSAGISLAHREFLNAQGAALLFATNLVAIIVGAAVTFRLLGVTTAGLGVRHRRWVLRVSVILGLSLAVLVAPLQRSLNHLIDQGRAQPTTYPLTKALDRALVNFIESYAADVELVVSGRPSALYDRADVVLVLSSPHPLPKTFAYQLQQICRDEMEEPELVVEVHCFLDAWKDSPE